MSGDLLRLVCTHCEYRVCVSESATDLVVEMAAAMGGHIRGDHDDEVTAVLWERYAIEFGTTHARHGS